AEVPAPARQERLGRCGGECPLASDGSQRRAPAASAHGRADDTASPGQAPGASCAASERREAPDPCAHGNGESTVDGGIGRVGLRGCGHGLLSQVCRSREVMKLGLPRLGKFWHRASRGKADPRLAERVFKACQTTVELYSEQRRTGQLPFDYVAVAEELQAELDRIDRCEQEVAQLDDRITESYHRIDPDRVLETIPGIAKVIAPAIEAFVGDVERFLNSRCFVSNCGLCPRKKQSGLSDQPMPITKAGQRLLKKYFYLAAETARQW